MSLWLASAAMAHEPSGAIFTTVADGSEVNFNIYPSKEAVYLDGGPGPGAPQTAAGLDDGTYVFQVTDPSGKTLLSTDVPKFRQFVVVGGIIDHLVVPGHLTGLDVDHDATTVQLMPYKDTPNNGGVYKAWVVELEDYKAGARAMGVKAGNELNVNIAGVNGSNKHGFISAHCKTDNFKVKQNVPIEIDTIFYDKTTGDVIDGLGVTWVDTLGASNRKYSYWAPALNVNHEAHVENVEPGTHTIVIEDGPGYEVNVIHLPDGTVINGPGEVQVKIPTNQGKPLTVFIRVGVDVLP